MSKQKPQYPKCPCCATAKHRTEVKICIAELKKLSKKDRHHRELEVDAYRGLGDYRHWACDACLDSGRAITANVSAQQCGMEGSWLVYFDYTFACKTCQNEFQFSREEQQLWYEQLGFLIYAQPTRCKKCRAQARLWRSQNTLLSDILAKKEVDISVEELRTVAEIYRKWGKIDKAKYYDALIRKRK